MLRRWMRESEVGPAQVFPGDGQLRPEQLEIARMRPRSSPDWRRRVTCLKKKRGVLRDGCGIKFAFIARQRLVWPVT
jgi:transposase